MLETVLMDASIAVACAVALLNIIAPLTKTDADNKVLALLRWVEDVVLKTLIPQTRLPPPPPPPAA